MASDKAKPRDPFFPKYFCAALALSLLSKLSEINALILPISMTQLRNVIVPKNLYIFRLLLMFWYSST